MSVHELDPGRTDAAVAIARRCFLESDNRYGCAESTLVALRESFGLPDPADSSPAVALNGGFVYSGGTCGALSGAGLAVGQLAERRFGDHRLAKTAARSLIQDLLDDFIGEFGSANCRDLIGLDLRAPGVHDAFIASGRWRDDCMRQIGFVVRRLAPLSAADWARPASPDAGPGPVAAPEQAR